MRKALVLIGLILLGVFAVAWTPKSNAAAGTLFDHVVIIAMENQNYVDVMGSGTGSPNAPFLQTMLTVSSTIPNYDSYIGGTLNGCSAECYTAVTSGHGGTVDGVGKGSVAGNNIFTSLTTAGLTWKAFCEDGCPRGPDHFPSWQYANTANSANNVMSTGPNNPELITELNSASPASLIWFTPTDGHNMHDNSIPTGDTYLKNLLIGSGTLASPASGSVLASNLFKPGQKTMLYLWWDEYSPSPNLLYGPMVKTAFISSASYNEYASLHMIESNWGLACLVNDCTAPTMTDMFGSTPPVPLSTSFTVSPSTPIVSLPVTFTATTTGGISPYTINWNFGDGTTGTSPSITHIFATVQSFTVTETATDTSSPSQTATSSKVVAISTPPPPSTSFTFLPSNPVINSPVTFTATTTGGTAPYMVSWTFGDGATGTGTTVAHSYTTAQSFTVTETSTDSSTPAQTATNTKTVPVVTSLPLTTSFTFLPTNPAVNTPVSLTSVTTGGTLPYTIAWNFGDGSTGAGASVTHTYTTAQSFTVTETATDSSSPQKTTTVTHTIIVSSTATGTFDSTWFINNCPGGTETITNGVLQTRQSTPGGGSNSYGYCTAQRGTFPWHSTVGTALPSGITSATVSFNFLSRTLLSGSRYHLYVALYYQIPSSSSGSTTYSWLDTQSRVENIDGVDSPIGSTATYDPGDSFGWDIVTLQVNPGQSGVITADATQLCQGDLAAWGLPANTQCTLLGIEIGTEGYLVNSVNVDWYNVVLNTGPPPPPTQLIDDFSFTPTSPQTSQSVSFSGTASGGTAPFTYSWNFGDSRTGSGQYPSHAYSSPGTYTVTLTVSDASNPQQTATATHTVIVTVPVPTPDFSISPNVPTLTVQAGSATQDTISLTSIGGYTGTVTLTPGISPSGLTISLTLSTVTLNSGGTGATTLQVSTRSSTSLGTYTMAIGATDGALSHSAQVILVVISTPPPPDFAISSSPNSMTIIVGSSGSSTITLTSLNNFAGMINLSQVSSSTLATSLSRSSLSLSAGQAQTLTLTVTPTSGASSGTYTVTVTGTAGTLVRPVTITVYLQTPVNYPPSLTIPSNQTTTTGSWINFTITATDLNPTSIVTFSATGLPAGATFNPTTGVFSWKPNANQTGYYTIIFTAVDDSPTPLSSPSKPVGIQVNRAAPAGGPGGGTGGSGSNSKSGCPLCNIFPMFSTSMGLLVIGGLLGLVTSLALLTVKARANLERTKRRMRRLTRND